MPVKQSNCLPNNSTQVLEAVHTSSEQKSAAGKEEGKGKASAGTGTGLTFIMRMWHLHTLAGTALRYGHLRLAAWVSVRYLLPCTAIRAAGG